jgi:phosphoribosylanthranilate isomerase
VSGVARAAVFRCGVQVAGICDAAEAEMVQAAGAVALGFPLRLKDGREDLSEAAATSLIRALSPRIATVLITYQTEAEAIVDFAAALGVSWVQFHGDVSQATVARVRALAPELGLIKALVIQGAEAAPVLEEARRFAPSVDAFLTDTFDPATGRRGATGLTHPWAVSRAVVDAELAPVILAGGLSPANVAAAIEAVRPWAVDAHSALEGADGRKDPACVHAFLARAQAAFKRFPPRP